MSRSGEESGGPLGELADSSHFEHPFRPGVYPGCLTVEHSEADRVAVTGWARPLCGATLPREDLDLAAQPSPPLLFLVRGRATVEPPDPSQSGFT